MVKAGLKMKAFQCPQTLLSSLAWALCSLVPFSAMAQQDMNRVAAAPELNHSAGPQNPVNIQNSYDPGTSGPSTPGFVSGRSGEATTNGMDPQPWGIWTQPYSGCPSYTYCVGLPQASLARNLLTVFVEYSSLPSTTLSITTDRSQRMTTGPITPEESSNLGEAFYLCGAAAGTRMLEITSSDSASINIYHVFVAQWDGVATSGCLDTDSKNAGSRGTTVTAGPIRPMAPGDLLVMDGCAAGTPTQSSFTAGAQSNIVWTKRGDDIVDGCMEQSAVDSSKGALDPRFTLGTPSTFLATAMAFRAAQAGTAPRGMYIVYQTGTNAPTSAHDFKFEFPSTGNLQVVFIHGPTPVSQIVSPRLLNLVTSIGDSSRNWSQLGTDNADYQTFYQPDTGGENQAAWAAFHSSPDPNGALTLKSTSATITISSNMTFYDIAGAASSPLVNRLVVAGHQTIPSNLTVTTTYFPGTTSGITLVNGGQQGNTFYTLSSPPCGLPGAATFGGMALNGPATPDQNNVIAACANTSAKAQTWTADYISPRMPADWWAIELDTFVPPHATYVGPSYIQSPSREATSASYITVPLAATQAGSGLVAAIGARASSPIGISRVCTGTSRTCARGILFTIPPGSKGSFPGHASADAVLFGVPTGTKDVTIVTSETAANLEAQVFEIRNLSGSVDASGHVSNAAGTGFHPYTLTGASVTTTGSPDVIVSNFVVGASVVGDPQAGSSFGYGGALFKVTADAVNSRIADPGTYTSRVSDSHASDTFCNSTIAVK